MTQNVDRANDTLRSNLRETRIYVFSVAVDVDKSQILVERKQEL